MMEKLLCEYNKLFGVETAPCQVLCRQDLQRVGIGFRHHPALMMQVWLLILLEASPIRGGYRLVMDSGCNCSKDVELVLRLPGLPFPASTPCPVFTKTV